MEKEEEKEDEVDDVFYDMNSIVCFVVMTALLCALFQGLSFMWQILQKEALSGFMWLLIDANIKSIKINLFLHGVTFCGEIAS